MSSMTCHRFCAQDTHFCLSVLPFLGLSGMQCSYWLIKEKQKGKEKSMSLLSTVSFWKSSSVEEGWLCHETLFLVYLLPVVTIVYVFLLGFYLKGGMVLISVIVSSDNWLPVMPFASVYMLTSTLYCFLICWCLGNYRN